MRIESIIDQLQVISEGGLYVFDFADAIATLDRLKPVTITDDPATWPEEGRHFILYILAGTVFSGFREAFREEDFIYDCNGAKINSIKNLSYRSKWAYLPEWEG